MTGPEDPISIPILHHRNQEPVGESLLVILFERSWARARHVPAVRTSNRGCFRMFWRITPRHLVRTFMGKRPACSGGPDIEPRLLPNVLVPDGNSPGSCPRWTFRSVPNYHAADSFATERQPCRQCPPSARTSEVPPRPSAVGTGATSRRGVGGNRCSHVRLRILHISASRMATSNAWKPLERSREPPANLPASASASLRPVSRPVRFEDGYVERLEPA